MPAYSFGGVDFGPTPSEHQLLVGPAENFFSLRHVIYSNANVLDLGGVGANVYGPIDIRVDPDDEATLRTKLHTTASLTVADVVYPSATLVQLTGRSQTPRGEWFYFTAQWVIG